MAGRKPKIIWTLSEESDFYAAFIAELKERGLEFPVKATDLKQIMRAAKVAMKVIKVERRRDINSVDGFRGELAKRLIDNGVFPRDHLNVLRRSPRATAAAAPDPRDARIAELEATIATMQENIIELNVTAGGYLARIGELESQPTPVQVVEDFFARIIARGLGMKADADKPAFIRPAPAPLPQHERDRRANGGEPTPTATDGRAKIALLGAPDGDIEKIHRELGSLADMRYTWAPDVLKRMNANGGRIVVWTGAVGSMYDHALSAKGLTFSRYQGKDVDALIAHLKQMAAR